MNISRVYHTLHSWNKYFVIINRNSQRAKYNGHFDSA